MGFKSIARSAVWQAEIATATDCAEIEEALNERFVSFKGLDLKSLLHSEKPHARAFRREIATTQELPAIEL